MSLKKSATRRVRLLTGSSLIAASLAAAGSLGVTLAPTNVAAQAVCAPVPEGGAGTSSVTYSGTAYAAGIDCTSNGNMTVAVTSAGVDVGGAGIDLTGVGANTVTFNSNIEIDGVNLVGPLMHIDTVSGAINVSNAGTGLFLDADQSGFAAMTHGLLLQSATGNIAVNATGEIDAQGGNTSVGSGIEASTGGAGAIDISVGIVRGHDRGIYAATQSGDIDVEFSNFVSSNSGGTTARAGIEASSTNGGDIAITGVGASGVNGRLYGVYASTTGAGNITINMPAGRLISAQGGTAAAYVSAGTGAVEVNANLGNTTTTPATYGLFAETDGDVSYSGQAVASNTGVYIDTSGDIEVTGIAEGAVGYGMDVVIAAGSTATLNLMPGTFSTSFGGSATSGGLAAVRASGAGDVVVNVHGIITGRVDFSGLATRPELNIVDGGRWDLVTGFALSNSIAVSTEGTGILRLGRAASEGFNPNPTFVADPVVTLTFNGANDVFDNAGRLAINFHSEINDSTRIDDYEGETVLSGLEIFKNSGVVYMGRYVDGPATYETDGHPDDILTLPGTNYIGEGGTIRFDIDLSGASQTSCDPADRDPVSGSLPAADCLRIPGGSTEGVTFVDLNELFPFDRGSFNSEGIVLVDVEGGTSAAGHFVIDPDTRNYSTQFGGSIDKGVFLYTMAYDDTAKQHSLVGLVSGSSLQFPLLATAGHDLWRTSTSLWLGRQADLRDGSDIGAGGAWLRMSTEFSGRDIIQTTQGAGQTFAYDNSVAQNSYAVTGGADLVTAAGGDAAFVAGVTLGYAHADVDYKASVNTASFDGWTGGLYASYLAGPLFVDAAVNANKLVMDNDIPSLGLFPDGSILTTNVLSVGGELQAGWKFALGGGVFVEPLAGLSYVQSKFDDVEILADDPARERIIVEYDDPTSLRGSLGGRMGLEQDYGWMKARYSLLGRIWEEFEDGAGAVILSGDQVLPVLDDSLDRLSEFGVGASLHSSGGVVSGFVNFGGKFADDYTAQNGSVGVRVNW